MNSVSVDLVLLGLSGVQRFITESRTTTDVVNASRIIQRLATAAARTVQRELEALPEPCRLIYPVLGSGPDPEGVTSKIAFLAEPGAGADIARKSVTEVHEAWQKRSDAALHRRRQSQPRTKSKGFGEVSAHIPGCGAGKSVGCDGCTRSATNRSSGST